MNQNSSIEMKKINFDSNLVEIENSNSTNYDFG